MTQSRWTPRFLGDWPVQTVTVWPELLNQKQAAAYLGYSTKRFRSLCPVEAVVIPYTHGKRQHTSRRYRRADLDRWILAQGARAPQGARRVA